MASSIPLTLNTSSSVARPPAPPTPVTATTRSGSHRHAPQALRPRAECPRDSEADGQDGVGSPPRDRSKAERRRPSRPNGSPEPEAARPACANSLPHLPYLAVEPGRLNRALRRRHRHQRVVAGQRQLFLFPVPEGEAWSPLPARTRRAPKAVQRTLARMDILAQAHPCPKMRNPRAVPHADCAVRAND